MKTHKVRPVLVESIESTLHLSHGKLLITSIESTGKSDLYKSIPQELILISLENEKIEEGDTFVNDYGEIIVATKEIAEQLYFPKKKVIARQSQIPTEYISKFIEQYNNGCVEDLEIVMENRVIKHIPWSKELESKYDYEKGYPVTGYVPKLTNGFVSIVEKEYSHNLLSNMQYYMEYCQANGYVTPQDWLNKFKHYSDRKEPISYTEEEVKNMLGLFGKHIMTHPDLDFGEEFEEAIIWFEQNKKK